MRHTKSMISSLAIRPALAFTMTLAAVSAQGVLERLGDASGKPTGGGVGPSASSVRRGPFVSHQVNVDANGNNVIGDAGNEPSFALDPNDPSKLVAGWRQFDTVVSNFRQAGYAYSRDGGSSWTHPGSLQPGFFNSDPVIDTDAAGSFFYLGYPSGSTLNLFRSNDAGSNWSGPVVTPGGDKAWMTIDKTNSIGRGNIYILWQVASGPNTFTRSTDGGNTFAPATPVTNTPTFGTIAIDAAGTLYAAGLRGQRFSSFLMARSANARDANQTPTFTSVSINMGGSMGINAAPNPGGLAGQAQVAVDPSRPGYVYELCSVIPSGGANAMDVHLVRSTDGGTSFSAPVRVNDDPNSGAWHWFGTIAVAPDGRVDVVWNDTRASGVATVCETRYAYSLDAGQTFSASTPICPAFDSTIGWPNQNKIGDYYDMRSDGAAANLIYAATHNGEQDVWFVRLGDCNENGVHDSGDLASGFSFDSNTDTIVDECQFLQTDLGAGLGLQMLVGGDDLTQSGSRATVQVQGGPSGSPVFLVVAATLASSPLPLPGGGTLLPDLTTGFAAFAGNTNSLGKLGLAIGGGSHAVHPLYLQAVMVNGSGLSVSNAVEVQLGS